ncbi:MAG TPA: transglutaminase-like domain-containing protein [Bryobacteraceae bacterium]|nr:transglutaminase-like domain-containing protein [Bryobacteraceae bacterium]
MHDAILCAMQALLDLITGSEEAALDRAALEIARIEYPGLDIEPFIGLLDSYAEELSERLAASTGGQAYVAAANQYLFAELGFTGNAGDYYDPRNSCLNDVLTARTGIPITLAVVYLEIARRLARPVDGIGLPGHFLVRYRDAEFTAFIDVFAGGSMLSREECFALARRSTGALLRDDPAMLTPAGNRQIVMRMLRNLRGVYFHRRAYGKALQTLDLLLAGDPPEAEDFKLRGTVHLQLGNPAAARHDLETYLRLAPAAEDVAEVEQRLRALRGYQARLN